MDLVKSLAIAGLLALAPITAIASEPWADAITEASDRFGLPEVWVRELIRAESGGDVRALSPKGAMGLTQLMPATWSRWSATLGLGADPYQPRDNILAGVAYLRSLYDRYGAPAFLAAYNAGSGRLDDYLLRSRPLPVETRRYVDRLAPMVQGVPAPTPMSPPPTVFAVRHDGPPAVPASSADGLFAVRQPLAVADTDLP